MSDPRRAIPSVEKLLAEPGMQALLSQEPRSRVVAALRAVLESVRHNGAHAHDVDWYVRATSDRLSRFHAAALQRVINATGVVLHTNLGRAPLADAALAAINETAQGYSNLEYNLASGQRGSRYDHCVGLLHELTGAESALVVNNNAAALVLALNTFARGRQVAISRGELVEIGGSFRIPEILERSGAILREVGATNRTHLRDYTSAITSDVSVLLKVHRSNFEMSGYVSEVEASELAGLAQQHGLTFIHDLGSGLLEDLGDLGLAGEPTAREAVAAAPGGIISLSGDKLMGGPQAGILLGTEGQIAQLRANPLCRALRVDKLTSAALAATLRLYADGVARSEIPALRMLCLPLSTIEQRAHKLAAALSSAGIGSSLVAADSAVGGGAFPTTRLPTQLIVLDAEHDANTVEARLRAARTPVIARIVDDRLAIDLRTVAETDEPVLLEMLIDAARV